MEQSISGAIIGLCGTLLGVVITCVVQWIIARFNSKRAKEQVTLELKINTYADAIRYISLCASSAKNSVEIQSVCEGKELYNRFHPIFTIIAPPDVVEKYNDLRNEVFNKKLTHEEAHKKVIDILNFNINKRSAKK